MEFVESISVFRQRPGIFRAASASRAAAIQQEFYRDFQKHNMGPIASQQGGILPLNKGATSQRNYSGNRRTLEYGAKGLSLELAKAGFAVAPEDFADVKFLAAFYLVVKIEEIPA